MTDFIEIPNDINIQLIDDGLSTIILKEDIPKLKKWLIELELNQK